MKIAKKTDVIMFIIIGVSIFAIITFEAIHVDGFVIFITLVKY